MAALTRSDTAKLLENIAVEVGDTTNHGDLAELRNAQLTDPTDAIAITREAGLLKFAASPPYVLITLGDCAKQGDGQGRRDLQGVDLHLVHGTLGAGAHGQTLTGTTALSGTITLLEAIEAALYPTARWNQPYNQSPYNSGSYSALASVRGVWVEGWGRPEHVAFEGVLDDVFVVQALTARYHIEKGVS